MDAIVEVFEDAPRPIATEPPRTTTLESFWSLELLQSSAKEI